MVRRIHALQFPGAANCRNIRQMRTFCSACGNLPRCRWAVPDRKLQSMTKWVFLSLTTTISLLGAATGNVRGVVHDPQHRPLPGAQVVLHDAAITKTIQSDANGEFQISDVPEGAYDHRCLRAGLPTFGTKDRRVGGKVPRSASPARNPAAQHKRRSVGCRQPAEPANVYGSDHGFSAGNRADRRSGSNQQPRDDHRFHAGSLHGARYAPHARRPSGELVLRRNPGDQYEYRRQRGTADQPEECGGTGGRARRILQRIRRPHLRIFQRGDALRLRAQQRGRSWLLSAGNFHSTDDQFNIGSHTQRFAYYASVDGSRSDLGLAPPVSQILHDQSSGVGGFRFPPLQSQRQGPIPLDRLAARRSLSDSEHAGRSGRRRSRSRSGKRLLGGLSLDSQLRGRLNVYSLSLLIITTPRITSAGRRTRPFILNDNYSFELFRRPIRPADPKEEAQRAAGIEVWGQHDNTFFGLTANPGGRRLNQRQTQWANSNALFLEDQYKATSWLTLRPRHPAHPLYGASQ